MARATTEVLGVTGNASLTDADGRQIVTGPGGTGLVDSNAVYAGSTALTPKFAFANITASQTDASVVALVATKKIRVLALAVLAGGTATTIIFQSNATVKSATFANGINTPLVLPYNPVGWFETVAGEALKVTTGAGSTTGIHVVYVEV